MHANYVAISIVFLLRFRSRFSEHPCLIFQHGLQARVSAKVRYDIGMDEQGVNFEFALEIIAEC